MINFDTNCYHSVLDHDRTEWWEAILAGVPPTNTTNFWHQLLTVTFTKKRRRLSFKFWYLRHHT